MTRQWSKYQQDIYNFVERAYAPGDGNAIIVAVAGSGKSTTITEACERVKGSYIMLAFNKAIAEELKAKGVNARTFHSVCYTPVTRARMTPNVETNKLRMLCDKHMTSNDSFMYSTFACRLVGLARQSGVGCLFKENKDFWYAACEHHDIEVETEGADFERGIELARTLLDWSNASNLVDFDDLLYFCIKDDVRLAKYDFIFVDEAQDTNAIQRAILKKMMHASTRIIAVGDPNQAIYGFRGADSSSLDTISHEFNAIKLPLTVSYRCGNKIVEYAQQWVKHIEAAPGAQDGEVIHLEREWNNQIFKSTDLVVCRNTKPLVNLAYRLLKDHIPVQIMGREIGASLKTLINKMKASNIDDLITKVEIWAAREVEKATEKKLEAKAESVQDKADAIICLADSLAEDERTIERLQDLIYKLFSDKTINAVKLATIHKAKGMEADTVYWLNRSLCPSKWARRPWMKEQELNLCYVAATRAKTKLVTIEDGQK